ncbi:Junctophilin-1 [Tupaia chinensis]|uniref:Junctophilin-1 n=1 Tax=Tupaia chinensis TaxID=246437 RepID=L9LDH6_TUPCH|nr:Junctophilin-1 [Tupaia chinensis]
MSILDISFPRSQCACPCGITKALPLLTHSCAPCRTAHARAKADAADQAALAARQECDIARAVARELSPDFYQPGPDYIKQRFQEGVDAKENPEEKVPEKPPTPKESPHFYRKGTTPPRSPEASPKQSHSPQPPSPKPVKKQNPSSGARLNQNRRSLADEQVTAIVSKPLMSKAPTKETGAVVPQSKYSGRHHVPNPGNGELHSQYHGYYVKLNAPQHPPEDVEDDDRPSQSSSALVHKPSPNKWSPPKSVIKPVAKESKAEPKAKKSELAIPKNPASNDSCPSLEREANSSPSMQGEEKVPVPTVVHNQPLCLGTKEVFNILSTAPTDTMQASPSHCIAPGETQNRGTLEELNAEVKTEPIRESHISHAKELDLGPEDDRKEKKRKEKKRKEKKRKEKKRKEKKRKEKKRKEKKRKEKKRKEKKRKEKKRKEKKRKEKKRKEKKRKEKKRKEKKRKEKKRKEKKRKEKKRKEKKRKEKKRKEKKRKEKKRKEKKRKEKKRKEKKRKEKKRKEKKRKENLRCVV